MSKAARPASASRNPGTAERILDVAEGLVQVRGFNAFSYADIAKTLEIQKASLHYHFATKADLGMALVSRYSEGFRVALAAIEGETVDAMGRLARYAELYAAVLRGKRMCLCGMMAADAATLPRPLRAGIAAFFVENEAWLAAVLELGRRRGELTFAGDAASLAAFFVSSLEGAMLVDRGSGGLDHLAGVTRRLLDAVRPVVPATSGATRRLGAAGRES